MSPSEFAGPGTGTGTGIRSRLPLVLFVLASALYFADTLLRASLKTFWFDELFTVYLCRLPSFHATWTAVTHGADFNPPLFYLLTRGAEQLFGEGLISTRLPAILGLWVFGLCLYVFASRRMGRMAGAIAALAPLFTLADNYAYEARAHAIVLAWCGLMLVCWQRAREQATETSRAAMAWNLGLGVSFVAGLLTHVYAMYLAGPFLLVEGTALVRRRRVRWGTCAALLLAMALVAPLYLRMLRTFKTINTVGGVPLHNFILAMFGTPAIILMVSTIALTARDRARFRANPAAAALPATPRPALTVDELILAYALLLLPVIGAAGVALSHGPYFDRYFLACTAGFALLFAQGVGSSRRTLAAGVVTAMLLLLAGDTALALYARYGGLDLAQTEPSSRFRFSSNPAHPLERDAALLADTSNLDILVTEEHNFLFLYFYSPEQIRRRLVFAAPDEEDFVLVSDRRLAAWARIDLRTTTYGEIFANRRDFLVYASSNGLYNGGCGDCIQPFLSAGYTLRSIQRDADSLLEHFAR